MDHWMEHIVNGIISWLLMRALVLINHLLGMVMNEDVRELFV